MTCTTHPPLRLLIKAFAILLITSVSLFAQQTPPKYYIVDIDVFLNGNQPLSIFEGLNNNGDVIGTDVRGAMKVVVWHNGAITPLPGIPTGSRASMINDTNRVGMTTCCPVQATVWQDGSTVYLPYASPGDNQSGPMAINNLGQIAGTSGDGFGGGYSAVFWDGTTPVILKQGPPHHTNDAFAVDINDTTQIALYDAVNSYRWENGTLTPIGLLGGTQRTQATAINSAGHIVGLSSALQPNYFAHAFLWDGVVLQDLGSGGGLYSYASDINDSGQVVGHFYTGANIPFLYTNQTMYSLNDLLVRDSPGTVTANYGSPKINNAGQILTTAFINNQVHWVLLQPVSEAAPAGTNVVSEPVDSTSGTAPASLTFSNITSGGTTTLTTADSGATIPADFKLGSPATFYEIATTATYSGPIKICLNYSSVSYNNPKTLAIWHYSSGSWSKLDTTVDTSTSTVCALTPSLSPFVVLESAYSVDVQSPIRADGTSVFKSMQGSLPVKFTLLYKGVPTCQLPPATISVIRNGGEIVDPAEFQMPSNKGTALRIDAKSCQYIYNFNTKSLPEASYDIDVTLRGTTIDGATFSLR